MGGGGLEVGGFGCFLKLSDFIVPQLLKLMKYDNSQYQSKKVCYETPFWNTFKNIF